MLGRLFLLRPINKMARRYPLNSTRLLSPSMRRGLLGIRQSNDSECRVADHQTATRADTRENHMVSRASSGILKARKGSRVFPVGVSIAPLSTISSEGELDGLPLRVASQSPTSFQRVGWSILDCARRTSTFLSCAFREQEDDQAALSPLLPYAIRHQLFLLPSAISHSLSTSS